MNHLKLLVLAILLLLLDKPACAQTKHALIFAIGNYPPTGGWPVISSNTDVLFINRTLQKQGFLPANIKTVVDAAATVEGITQAFNNLIAKVQPGDIVTIHFSSHGEQVADDNQDEPDDLDETIVTYTAVSPSQSTNFKKDQAAYFRDDQFDTFINQLRRKLGKNGDVLVFIDACHSGSGSRGIAKVRGNQPPLVPKNFRKSTIAGTETPEVFTEGNATRGNESALATYVVISAARPEELNTETYNENKESMGSLTYAISKVFENLEPGTTYRTVFAKIQTVLQNIVPGQHPVMEGNGVDRTLFGGQYIQQKPYIEVESIKGNQLVLKGGKLAGLNAGAKVAVYPAGTNNPTQAKAIASGMVTKATYYSAQVKLASSLGEAAPASYWIFVTEPVYLFEPISIGFASATSGKKQAYSTLEQATIKNVLKDLPLIKFEGTPELILAKGNNTDSVKIAANGYVFEVMERTAKAPEVLKNIVQRYIQYRFLKELEIKDANALVEIKLVPVIHGNPDTTKINTKIQGGTYEFREGDTLVIWAKNPGTETVYLNILDIQPNGVINPIFPFGKQKIYSYELNIPGKTSRLFNTYPIAISPPYGTEVFKVFVSKEEIDVETIATSKGADLRAGFKVLEKLVKDSYDISTRGATATNIGNADGSTYNALFRIKPRK